MAAQLKRKPVMRPNQKVIMVERRVIESLEAPQASGGYAQALELRGATRFLTISGQIPEGRDGVVPENFREQCLLVWKHIGSQLRAADMSFDNLTKVTTYLSDRRYADENSEVRNEVLGDLRPALTVLIAGIYDPKWLLEIEATAAA